MIQPPYPYRFDVSVIGCQVDVKSLGEEEIKQPLNEARFTPASDLARDAAFPEDGTMDNLIHSIDDNARHLDGRVNECSVEVGQLVGTLDALSINHLLQSKPVVLPKP